MRIGIELDIHRPRKDGTCAVRLTLYRKSLARFPLGFHVHPKHWDKARRRVRFGAVKNWEAFNEVITEAHGRAEALALRHPAASPQDLVRLLSSPDPTGQPLQDALLADLERNASRLSYGTTKGRRTVIRDLDQALGIVTLSGFTTDHIEDLDRWYVGKGLSSNSRRTRLRRLRTMLRSVCKCSNVQPPSFEGIIPKEVDTGVRYLSKDEFERLRAAGPFERNLSLARDAWLLQFHLGGVRFGDVCRLSHAMNVDGGWAWTVGKVGRPAWAPDSPEIQAIAKRWKDRSEIFVLPLLSVKDLSTDDSLKKAIESANAQVNVWLKKVSKLAGIRPLTTHMARHTWAVLARDAGVDVWGIKGVLGHSRIQQTVSYMGKFDREATSEVFRKVRGSSSTPSGQDPSS